MTTSSDAYIVAHSAFDNGFPLGRIICTSSSAKKVFQCALNFPMSNLRSSPTRHSNAFSWSLHIFVMNVLTSSAMDLSFRWAPAAATAGGE
eukprot:CAMPEP_0185300284 /NCGR_PEP_ID=MMETSP1363-20130426/11909_1 /TAXON_ID=38817 /ORGANISM="Gephyrocapsa oceanica, Strain RCC1303" /LENGTH=90 /DNA_ID=CAMNT_0027897233 /DNA_START=455 /DNA_END=727 /DNA_ORIENTATION=-